MFDKDGNITKVGHKYWIDKDDEEFSQAAHSRYPYEMQWKATPGKLLYRKDE